MTTTTDPLADCLKAKCSNCHETFDVPAIGVCPECGSRQVRSIHPCVALLEDARAELDNCNDVLEGVKARIDKAQAAIERALRRMQ
jgi:reverse gyrase